MPKTHPLPSLQTIVGQKNGKKIVQAEGFLTAPFRLNVIYSSIRYANFDEHSPFLTVVLILLFSDFVNFHLPTFLAPVPHNAFFPLLKRCFSASWVSKVHICSGDVALTLMAFVCVFVLYLCLYLCCICMWVCACIHVCICALIKGHHNGRPAASAFLLCCNLDKRAFLTSLWGLACFIISICTAV